MSDFFNDIAKGLSEAVAIKEGKIPVKEVKGAAAPTYRADWIDPRGTTWDELKRELFTPEEIATGDRRVKKKLNRTRRRQARRRKRMLR